MYVDNALESDETKSISVTYTFLLPEHEYEKKLVDLAPDLLRALEEISNECRRVMKYEPNVADAYYNFAEKIREIVSDVTWRLE